MQQRQEHVLAVAVGVAVEGVDGPVAEQRPLDRLGDGGVPPDVPLVVEEPHGIRAAHDDGGLAHHPGVHGPATGPSPLRGHSR